MQPAPREEASGVGVGPVGVAEAAMSTGCWTKTVGADNNVVKAVEVGAEVAVGKAVFVAVGAIAVVV